MLNNSVSNSKLFIIKNSLYCSAIALIVVALLLSSFAPINVAYADTEESYINFNQIAPTINNSNYIRYSGITNTVITYSQNSFTIYNNAANNSSYQYGFVTNNTVSYISGHKYYINMDVLCSYSGVVRLELWAGYSQLGEINTIPNETVKCSIVSTCNSTTNRTMLGYISGSNNYPYGTTTYSNIMIIDLTQCFGESIANNLTVNDIENMFPSPYYNYTLSYLLPLSSLTNQEYYDKGYKDGQAQNNNVVYSSSVSNISLDNTSNQNVEYIGNLNYNGSVTYTTKNNEKFWRIFLDGITLKTATKYTLKWEYLSTTNSNLESALLRYTDSNYSNEVADIFESPSGELSFYYYSNYDFEWLSLDLATTDDSGITNITFKLTITAVNDISMAYDLGYEYGEDAGYNTGYSVGYDKGYSEGNYNGIQHNTNTLNGSFWSFLSSMFSSISNLLHIELYDGITIGVVIMIPLLFTILMLILKLVRG